MKKSLFLIVLFSLITSSAWAHRYYSEQRYNGERHHYGYRNNYSYHSGRYWQHIRAPYYHHHQPIYRFGYRDHGSRLRIAIR